jgi:hypothetical protein
VDNGVTFSAPLNGTPGFVAGFDVADKPWIAVDNYPGPGSGNAYLAWTDFTSNFEPVSSNNGTYFTRSTDDGLTWGPGGGVPLVNSAIDNNEVSHGAFVAVGPDHAVYVFYWGSGYQSGGETELMRKSTDFGQTFGPQVIVANLQTKGANGDLGLTNSAGQSFRSNAFPQAAINPVTGDIYVVYDDEPKEGAKDNADIFFTESTDGGNTWSNPLRVNDDNTTNDQWQPALAVTPDGSHVGIFWYDRRLDPANNLIDRFGSVGTVSGHTVSFAPNFRITDASLSRRSAGGLGVHRLLPGAHRLELVQDRLGRLGGGDCSGHRKKPRFLLPSATFRYLLLPCAPRRCPKMPNPTRTPPGTGGRPCGARV